MVGELIGPLPIKVDATSNGEFRPVPLAEHVARANREAERRIGEHAKRVGIGRRAFLQSLCGAATTLLTLNKAFAALAIDLQYWCRTSFPLPFWPRRSASFGRARAPDLALLSRRFAQPIKLLWAIKPPIGVKESRFELQFKCERSPSSEFA